MNTVLIILVFQSFILAASLLVYKKNSGIRPVWIGAYFVTSGMYFLGLYVNRLYGFSSWEIFQRLTLLLTPLINPIFFIGWRKANGYVDFSLKHLSLHFLPFLGILLYTGVAYLGRGTQMEVICLSFREITPWIKILFNAQWILYIVLIFIKLFKSLDLKWTAKQWQINAGGVLLGSYILGYFFHCVELYSYYSSVDSLSIPYLFPFHSNLLILFTFITTNFLLFKSVDHQKAASHAISHIVANGKEWAGAQTELNHIVTVIESQKLFTKPDLTLSIVAEKTGLKERTISSVINSVTNKGFNEYINELRVNEAKKLLKDTDKSIKEIQYDVGFKSKTTFFDSFKRMTNKTPKEFRENGS